MWESESDAGREYDNEVLNSNNHGVKTDGFERKDQSWYVATDIPSDLLVQVGDVSFHLHKYPLLSRSGKMNRIIYDLCEGGVNKMEMNDIPGGSDAFELVAKFCYGIAVDLTATNISGLRCAAEYLEMTEDLEEGNLIFKTEAFLSYVVLSSWRDSILVLKNCEELSPWAENLQIVRRCCESIAWKACANPRGIKWAYTGKPSRHSSPRWNEIKESSPSRNLVPSDWWFEDVSILRIDHFVRVITAIKVKGMRFELIGAVIMHYAAKWLPGLTKEGAEDEANNIRDGNSGSWRGGLHMIIAANKEEPQTAQIKEQRMIIESLISVIPPQKDSVSCSFLLRLLKMANMLKVASALSTELEKRVGMQLEQANLADLLIPSYSKSETLYDVDLVQRLLEHFLVQESTELASPSRQSLSDKHGYETTPRGTATNAKMRVARLVDSYLTEVSRDRNLSLTKFQVIAEALPETARSCDDGLYRAVDSYLKAHPTLSEHERKRLCRVMDCQKLSIDACMHAAQNERLPLRVVVQVLFSEQIKISNAIANNALKETTESNYHLPVVSARKALLEGTPQSFQEGWSTAKKDINTLKFELESVKAKNLELQTEMENLQRQFDKMSKQKHTSGWTSGWKKLGSKLTKMTTENHDIESHQVSNTFADQTKKTPRRWRNSIS